MREDLTIIRSDAPSRILTAFEKRMPARQSSIQKRASVEEEMTFISLAEATERGFRKLAFDLYENPDYGSLWKLEDIDGEPWLVVYTDEDDNIIRKVASQLRSSDLFRAQWKRGDIVESGPYKRGEVQNVRHLRTGPEYLVDFGLDKPEWVAETELSSPIDVESAIDNRRLGEVVRRLKLAQNPPMSPSEDVAPMGFNIRTDEEELSDPEIKQFFEEKEKKEKKEEPEVEVKTEPAGVGGREEILEMKFPDRVRHIKIDLEGEEGEAEEEEEIGVPEAAPPTGTTELPEGIPGPGLGGEVPVTF